MDDFLTQLFPQDAERWIKVKYTDPEKAMGVIRLNSPTFSNDHNGIEVVAIGVRDDYTPQIEALVELKADLQRDYAVDPTSKDHFNSMIDYKISEVINKVLISKGGVPDRQGAIYG